MCIDERTLNLLKNKTTFLLELEMIFIVFQLFIYLKNIFIGEDLLLKEL
jgi:hypothetical protein